MREIPQNYIVFFGAIAVAIIVLAVFFGGFAEPANKSEIPEKIYINTVKGDKLVRDINGFVKIHDMPPNSAALFYYPDSENYADRDAFNAFNLIRLPEPFGGSKNDVSAFRAYSALDISSHCLIKYWPQEERQQIEDPCGGNMYNPITGHLQKIGGSPILIEKNSALPYLELSADKEGYLYAEPPEWVPDANGVIGIGRTMSDKDAKKAEETVSVIRLHIKKEMDSFYLPEKLISGHNLSHVNENSNSRRTAVYSNTEGLSGDNVIMSYQYCNCTRPSHEIMQEEKKPNGQGWMVGNDQFVYGYPASVNSVSGEKTHYTFVFYHDGFKIKTSTRMGFDDGMNMIKHTFLGNTDYSIYPANARCNSTSDIQVLTGFDLSLPKYLPPNYVFAGCQGTPFEAQIMYHDMNKLANTHSSLFSESYKHVADGALYLYVTDEMSIAGNDFVADIGNTDEFIAEQYHSAKNGNSSLNVDLIEIAGHKAFVTKSCEDCGIQTAEFPDGTEITNSYPVPNKIKLFDDAGAKYFFQSGMSFSELLKVAQSIFD